MARVDGRPLKVKRDQFDKTDGRHSTLLDWRVEKARDVGAVSLGRKITSDSVRAGLSLC